MKLSGFEPNPDLEWQKIGDVPAPSDLDEDYDYRTVVVLLP